MGTTHIVACLDASSARLTQVAKPRARVRLGDAVGCVDCTDTGAVRYLPGHRRARTRQPFQLGMGAGQHGFRLGRARANHLDLDAGLRGYCNAGCRRGHAQRHQAVSDGRIVLPMVRSPGTKRRQLILVTHFIAVTLWVECFRLMPRVPRARRIAFTHGLGFGLLSVCIFATALGYGLAANLPELFGAAILLLTPLAFLLSTARNCRQFADVLALLLGLALFPLVALLHTGIDILISGISAGTIAYAVHWWREQQ